MIRLAAVLQWFIAFGLGVFCIPAIRNLLTGRDIPIVMGFPAYGRGPFERIGLPTTVPLLAIKARLEGEGRAVRYLNCDIQEERQAADTTSKVLLDRLTAATRVMIARAGARQEIVGAAHRPGSLDDLAVVSRFLVEWTTGLGIPLSEQTVLMERLLTLLTSCDERRYEQWEHQSWWEFVGAERRSEAFRTYLADALTRSLVAARAREMSARTGGLILAHNMRRPPPDPKYVEMITTNPDLDTSFVLMEGAGIGVTLKKR